MCLSVTGEFKAYEALTFHLPWGKRINGLQACKWPWQFKKKALQKIILCKPDRLEGGL